MKKEVEIILNSYDMRVSDLLIKSIVDLKLNLEEFIVLLYFYNDKDKIFNPEVISNQFGLNESVVIEAISNLINKKLLEIENGKDTYGKMIEKINVNGLHTKMMDCLKNETKKTSKANIFEIFEIELKRTLSPMEYEIINAWLDNNITEELIIGALKEAVYNGVNNFRYIDKIIYEWGKKGFKNMDDVKSHLVKKDSSKSPELFDYNWLDDDEE